MCDDLLEVWRTNNRTSLHLIDRISNAGMQCTLSKRGGRGVAGQFGHIHNVRVWHLEKRAQDLATGLVSFSGQAGSDAWTAQRGLQGFGCCD